MVRVKYLGKSKRSFGVTAKGVQYKWKPEMTHLEMDEDHARVLVAERPDLWSLEGTAVVEAAPEWVEAVGTSGYDPTATEADAPRYKSRRKSEGTDESG